VRERGKSRGVVPSKQDGKEMGGAGAVDTSPGVEHRNMVKEVATCDESLLERGERRGENRTTEVVVDTCDRLVVGVLKGKGARISTGTDYLQVSGAVALRNEFFTEMIKGEERGEDAVLDFLAEEKESACAMRGVPAGVREPIGARSRDFGVGEEGHEVMELGRGGPRPVKFGSVLVKEQAEHGGEGSTEWRRSWTTMRPGGRGHPRSGAAHHRGEWHQA